MFYKEIKVICKVVNFLKRFRDGLLGRDTRVNPRWLRVSIPQGFRAAVHWSQKINIELVILFLFKYSLERESALILNLFRCVFHSVILINFLLLIPQLFVISKKKNCREKVYIICNELWRIMRYLMCKTLTWSPVDRLNANLPS